MSTKTEASEAQRGQILPLFAISMVAILALMGLGLDGARMMVERRVAQGAADLAALSGARLLPNQAAAGDKAFEIAAANGFPADQLTVTFPAASKIRVEVAIDTPMLFTPIIGLTKMDVGAGATAIHEEAVVGGASVPLAGPAILAYDNVCGQNDTLKWDAHNTTINGNVVVNAGGDINGSNNVMNGTETWYTTGSCSSSLFIDPAQNPDPDFQVVTERQSYPLDPTAQPFGDVLAANGLCNVADMAALGVTVRLMDTDTVPYVSGTQIADGIYCRVDNKTTPTLISNKINIKTAGSWCDHCTWVSTLTQASAADIDMNPAVAVAADGTVCAMPANSCGGYPLFTYAPPGAPKDGINFSGSGQDWNGLMFSPTGTTHYSGHDAGIYDGAIWSRIVQIIGSGFQLNGPTEWSITGPGGASTPEVLALVE